MIYGAHASHRGCFRRWHRQGDGAGGVEGDGRGVAPVRLWLGAGALRLVLRDLSADRGDDAGGWDGASGTVGFDPVGSGWISGGARPHIALGAVDSDTTRVRPVCEFAAVQADAWGAHAAGR